MTDPSALARLAAYFHTTPNWIMVWIFGASIGVIVAVFSIGIRWVKWTENGEL